MTARAFPSAVSESLDLLRAGAAVLVVLGHTTQPVFSNGEDWLMPAAVAAVGVFFVLSGFLVAHTTDQRHNTPRAFFVARFSRLYAVLLPALLFTWLLDAATRSIDLATYAPFERVFPNYWLGVPLHLAFLSQRHGVEVFPGSNTPIWSLSMEAFFLVLFAGTTFCRSALQRGFAWAMVFLIMGPHVLALYPLWLVGVALHRFIQPGAATSLLSAARPLAVPVCVAVAALAVVLLAGVWPVGKLACIPFLAVGAAAAAFIILVAAKAAPELPRPLVVASAFAARRSFVVFLFHYPMLLLASAVYPEMRDSEAARFLAAAAVLAVCYLIAPGLEVRSAWWPTHVRLTLDRAAGFIERYERRRLGVAR